MSTPFPQKRLKALTQAWQNLELWLKAHQSVLDTQEMDLFRAFKRPKHRGVLENTMCEAPQWKTPNSAHDRIVVQQGRHTLATHLKTLGNALKGVAEGISAFPIFTQNKIEIHLWTRVAKMKPVLEVEILSREPDVGRMRAKAFACSEPHRFTLWMKALHNLPTPSPNAARWRFETWQTNQHGDRFCKINTPWPHLQADDEEDAVQRFLLLCQPQMDTTGTWPHSVVALKEHVCQARSPEWNALMSDRPWMTTQTDDTHDPHRPDPLRTDVPF